MKTSEILAKLNTNSTTKMIIKGLLIWNEESYARCNRLKYRHQNKGLLASAAGIVWLLNILRSSLPVFKSSCLNTAYQLIMCMLLSQACQIVIEEIKAEFIPLHPAERSMALNIGISPALLENANLLQNCLVAEHALLKEYCASLEKSAEVRAYLLPATTYLVNKIVTKKTSNLWASFLATSTTALALNFCYQKLDPYHTEKLKGGLENYCARPTELPSSPVLARVFAKLV